MSNRARTRERRKQREQERKRNRQILTVGAIVALAIIAALLVIVANQPAEAPIPEGAVAEYEGIEQTQNDAGFPVLGDPDAPVQVVEYSSFDCPHCADFHETVTPQLVERARAGEINFTYVPLYGTGGIPNGEGAAKAAICAADQDAFWSYHTALFTWQRTYGNQAFAGNRLETGIDNLEIDRGEWDACFGSNRPNEVLVAANGQASQLEGFTGTPTVTVNGQIVTATLSDINNAIDAALASAPPPAPDEEPAAEVTEEAESEAEATEEAEVVEEAEATDEAAADDEAEEAATQEATEEVEE